MTKAISLFRLIEEARDSDTPSIKNFTGAVANIEELVANLDALERAHKGLYCFLAFHPTVDTALAQYVTGGSLGSDSGRRILVLFLTQTEFRTPQPVTPKALDLAITLDFGIHPSYQMVEWLFPANHRPALPGLVIFDRLFDVSDAVYIPLSKAPDLAAVASSCRHVFTLMEQQVAEAVDGTPSFDAFCATLLRENIDYRRTATMSPREWLTAAVQFVVKHGSSIAGVVGKLAKSAAKPV